MRAFTAFRNSVNKEIKATTERHTAFPTCKAEKTENEHEPQFKICATEE